MDGYYFNDLVTFDLNTLSSPNARWELVQAVTDPPSARTGHICLSFGDKLVVYFLFSQLFSFSSDLFLMNVALAEQMGYNGSMIPGSLTPDQIHGSK